MFNSNGQHEFAIINFGDLQNEFIEYSLKTIDGLKNKAILLDNNTIKISDYKIVKI